MGDLTVVVVCSMEATASTALGGVLYKFPDVSAPPFDGLQVFANLAGGGRPAAGLAGEGLMLTASAGSTVADGKLHVLALRRAGSALTLRLDGTQVAALTATPRSVDSVSPLQVGGRAALTHNLATSWPTYSSTGVRSRPRTSRASRASCGPRTVSDHAMGPDEPSSTWRIVRAPPVTNGERRVGRPSAPSFIGSSQ